MMRYLIIILLLMPTVMAADVDKLFKGVPDFKPSNEFFEECAEMMESKTDMILDAGDKKVKLSFVDQKEVVVPESVRTDMDKEDAVAVFNRYDNTVYVLSTDALRVAKNIAPESFINDACSGFYALASQLGVALQSGGNLDFENCNEVLGNVYEMLEDTPNQVWTKISAYRTAFKECQGDEDRGYMVLHSSQLYANLWKIDQAVFMNKWIYERYKGTEFEELASDALYWLAFLEYNRGQCPEAVEWGNKYLQEYEGDDPAADLKITRYIIDCKTGTKFECRDISVRGENSDQLNVVFIGDGYTSSEVMRSEIMQSVDQGLFRNAFMKQFRDDFNIYWIDTTGMDFCENLDPFTVGECNSEKVDRVVTACPHVATVVLSKKYFRSFAFMGTDAFVSVAGEGIGFSDLNTLLHESGHALFRLADEYTEVEEGDRPNSRNCFDHWSDARAYWTGTLGLTENLDFTKYPGCAYVRDNVRGTNCTVMRGDDDCEMTFDLGPINEALIRRHMEAYS